MAATLRGRPGFTLVEMLAVMAIIVIMITLVTPAAVQILRGNNLTQTGEMVGDQISLARQAALASSRPVQVRFYQLPVPSAGTPLNYAAMQSFRLEENGQVTALTKLQPLRSNVIFASGSALSTLLTPTSPAVLSVNGTDKLAAYGSQDCKYVGFQFLPNGGTDLDPVAVGGRFITMIEATPGLAAGAACRIAPLKSFTVDTQP